MVIHVLDRDFNLVGVVDDYISVIWRPAYYDIGDFELYINATSKAVELLKRDYYLVRDTDIVVDENRNISYLNVMIIKNFTLTTDAEEGDKLTYTGRELKYILNSRIVWSQTNLNGTVENAIRQLIDENAIGTSDPKRIIPRLQLERSNGFTETIEMQITGEKLDKAIIDICTAYNYGWEIYISNGQFMNFRLYKGVNRSYGQSDNPYVVFSDDFDNIANSNYELNSENYANVTLIGGEGEGSERIYTTLNNDKEGLERYEVFTDARDISQNKDSDEAIDLSTYKKLLNERGNENLASLSITEGFSGEVLSDVAFKYGVDFYLGDTVTVVNKYGLSKNVKVLSAIESVDNTGVKLIPQFNI